MTTERTADTAEAQGPAASAGVLAGQAERTAMLLRQALRASVRMEATLDDELGDYFAARADRDGSLRLARKYLSNTLEGVEQLAKRLGVEIGGDA